jgi:hypothetical protein
MIISRIIKFIPAASLALLLATASSLGEEAGEAKLKAKRMIALRSGAKKAIELIESGFPSDSSQRERRAEMLEDVMLAKAEQYRERDKSRQSLQEVMRASLRESLEEQVDDIVARSAELSPLPIAREDLLAQTGIDWNAARDKSISSFMAESYDPIFESARESAVALQKERMASMIKYPAPEIIDEHLGAILDQRGRPAEPLGDKDFAELAQHLETVSIDRKAVFEEVDSLLAELSGRVLDDIRRQYQQQVDEFDKAAAESQTLLAEEIYTDTIAKLESMLAPRVGDKSVVPPAYPLFDALRRYAYARSEELASQRLADFIKSDAQFAIGRDQIRSLIESDLTAHHLRTESHARALEHFSQELRAAVLDSYLRAAEREKTDAVIAELRRMISDPGAAQKAYRERIAQELDKLFDSVRGEIAERQVRAAFKGIDKDWDASGAVAEFLHDRQRDSVQDYAQALELARISEEIDVSDASDPLIEESEALVLGLVDARAGPAARALGSQLLLIAEIEQERMDDLRAAVKAGSSADELLGDWMGEWRRRWEGRGQSREFPEAFRRTRAQMEKTVRQLFDSVSREQQTEAAAIEQGGEGEVDPAQEMESSEQVTEIEIVEEQSEQESERQEGDIMTTGMSAGMTEMVQGRAGSADCVFVFSDLDDAGCRLEFGRSGVDKSALIDFAPGEIEAAAASLAQALAVEIEAIATAKAERYRSSFRLPLLDFRSEPELSVYVRVDSRRLRHLTMLELRGHLQEQLDQLAERLELPSLDLDWNEWRSRPDQP